MIDCMQKLKGYLADLDIAVVEEDPEEGLLIVDDMDSGVTNLIIDCEDPIVIVEQLIMPVPDGADAAFFRRLLEMNATLVHGAFLLDEGARHVFYRDTLQLENLDKNELEGSIRALALALAEHGDELLEMSKQA
jgi:Putative bacterial sensory transduction regulator